MTESIFLLSNFFYSHLFLVHGCNIISFSEIFFCSLPCFFFLSSSFWIVCFVLVYFMLAAFVKCLVILFWMGWGKRGSLSVVELHHSLVRELTSLGSFPSLLSWLYKLLVEEFSNPLPGTGERGRVCQPGCQHSGNGNGKGD